MSASVTPRQVLLIDDDAVILRGYGQRLRAEGYDVTTCADGYEALTVLTQRAWDLILLDLRIPYKNGVEVLRTLRARKETAETPVIVLAQPGDADFIDRAMREGANGVFEKAKLAPRDLVMEIDSVLDGRRRSVRPVSMPGTQRAPAGPAPGASAPPQPSVDDIARRFRKDAPIAVRPVQRSAPHIGAPAQAAPMARQVRAPYEDDAGTAGSQRVVAPAPAASIAAPPAPRVAAPGTFDVVLSRMVGQSAQLAQALGLAADYSCPICSGTLIMRAEPDPQVEFGIRGQFYCPRCTG